VIAGVGCENWNLSATQAESLSTVGDDSDEDVEARLEEPLLGPAEQNLQVQVLLPSYGSLDINV